MENRKGQGIFLGVVSVATLVVAILGATFAYFSAQVSSNTGAVNVTAYEFAVSFDGDITAVAPETETGLIPLASNLLDTALSQTDVCVDSNGKEVCKIYKATLKNTGAAETLVADIKTGTNGFVITTGEGETAETHTDLKVLGINYSGSAYTAAGSAVKVGLNADDSVGLKDDSSKYITYTINAGTQETPATLDVYFAVYLDDHDSVTEDQSAMMGKTFTGSIVFSSQSGNGGKITGTFTSGE